MLVEPAGNRRRGQPAFNDLGPQLLWFDATAIVAQDDLEHARA